MKNPIIFLLALTTVFWMACGSGDASSGQSETKSAEKELPKSIREGKGIGAITTVALTNPIDESMANKGKAISDMKCAACHKLDDKRVVGPGFEGVTNRRRPEWIMNMITNVDVMLDEDPTAQALLEECLTRMPNQNVSIGDARDILEFLRKNDEERLGTRDQALN